MHRSVLRLLAASLLASSALPVLAETARAADYGTTGIMLTVTDTTGKPLEGIGFESAVLDPSPGEGAGFSYSGLGTDAQGQLWLEADAGHDYAICAVDNVDQPGWSPTYAYKTACWNDATTLESATPIPIRTAGTRADITIAMDVAGLRIDREEAFVYGVPEAGSTLRVDTGAWSPSDVQLSYEWSVMSLDHEVERIVGTSPTYTPVAADEGFICVTVSATKSGYVSQTSHDCAGVLGNPSSTLSSPLSVTGTLRVGGTATATHGDVITAAGDNGVPSYEWLVDGHADRGNWGATGSTLPLTAAMVGKRVSVRMTTSYSADSQNGVREFALGPIVQGVLTAPTPTISGTAAVGNTLTANAGSWGPAPVTLAYQWYRSGAAISGATASTYTLTSTDLGKTMTVKVTGTNPNYVTAAKTSAATAAVLNSFTTAPTPTVTGTKAVGYTLTGALGGTWSPTPDSYSYRWLRDGVIISGASTLSYKLTSADVGHKIQLRVAAVKSGYATTYRYSTATAAIANVFTTSPVPTISGTKKVGYTLTANAGTWSPTPTSFTYQWYRGSTAISGATARTYTLTSYDKGKVVKVRVRPVLTGYYSPGKYSAGYTIG